jgi:purine-cytosine permease-like protein
MSFGLSLRDAALVILFFTLASTIPVAYLCTWGTKTGMWQLVQARFSFGKYFVSLLVLLNLATLDRILRRGQHYWWPGTISSQERRDY